ncbi:MAG: hypothetical protein ACI8ZN_002517, partial [Bacteroidia bacterium]
DHKSVLTNAFFKLLVGPNYIESCEFHKPYYDGRKTKDIPTRF